MSLVGSRAAAFAALLASVLVVLLCAGPASAAAPCLIVRSQPPGAAVYVDGRVYGITPAVLMDETLRNSLDRKVAVRVEIRDRDVEERIVLLSRREPVSLEFVLAAQPWCKVAVLGEATVVRKVGPAAYAQIWDEKAQTPCVAPWEGVVPPGRIELRLSRGGYLSQDVTIDAPSGGSVEVTPARWRGQEPRLDLSRVPAGVQCHLDENAVVSGARVAPGRHVLTFRRLKQVTRWPFEVTDTTRCVRYPGLMRPSAHLDAALRWLVEHQEEDGRFDAAAVAQRCGCEAGRPSPRAVSFTSLAALALLGAPADAPEPARQQRADAARRALVWLSTHNLSQEPKSEEARRFFSHERPLVAWALAEGFAATGDEVLRAPTDLTIGRVQEAQNPYLGWRYGTRDSDNDTTVTSFSMFAVGAAVFASAEADMGSLHGGAAWIDKLTEPEFGKIGYQSRGGGFAYKREVVAPGDDACDFTNTAMASCALLACRDLGVRTPATETALQARLLASHPMSPDAATVDFLYLWFGARVLHRNGIAGRDAWGPLDARWTALQETSGHAAGSFRPIDRWSTHGYGGRIYATAVMALALESASLE